MMRTIIKKAVLHFRESRKPILYATRVLELANVMRPMKISKRNHVHVSGAVMWDHLTSFMNWGDEAVRIWKYSKNLSNNSGRLIARSFKFELLSNLVEHQETLAWETDISKLHGFASSKSNLTDFETLHDLVLTNSQSMIADVSEDGLSKNLAHREIRIINSKSTSDTFIRYAWDGRLYLINSGGSHHLAAAKYIADQLDKRVPLKARYIEYSLNREVLKKLIFEHRIILIDDRDLELREAFVNALTKLKQYFIEVNLSVHICEHGKLIFLFNHYKETKTIANLLVKRGFQDIGALLMDQYSQQKLFQSSV